MGMIDKEKVIKGLECCITDGPDCPNDCPYIGDCNRKQLHTDALDLLKAQEPATEQPKRIYLQEETKAWLDEMDAVEVLETIADICQDWDGYRAADGLGGLINEIWAYARYCADRLLKAQEPVEPTLDVRMYGKSMWRCGSCSTALQPNQMHAKFCFNCGKAVKWNG